MTAPGRTWWSPERAPNPFLQTTQGHLLPCQHIMPAGGCVWKCCFSKEGKWSDSAPLSAQHLLMGRAEVLDLMGCWGKAEPGFGVSPVLRLLSPLQRRSLQPSCVPGRVAGRRAEHHDAHPLLDLPALRRDNRSQPDKGTGTGEVSLIMGKCWGAGTTFLLCQGQPCLPQADARPRGPQQQCT